MSLEWTSVPCLESGLCPPRGIWHEVPAPGIGFRIGSSANSLEDNSVLVIGGTDEDGPVSKVHRLDLNKVQWTSMNSANFPPRYEHATLHSGSSVYVFGGARAEGPLGDLWRYNADKDIWSPMETRGCVVSPRTSRCPATHQDLMVVFGGGHIGGQPASQPGPYVYSCTSNEWSQPAVSGPAPCPRQGHASACIAGQVYVHGGMAGEQFFSDLHVLDLATWKWRVPKVEGEVPSPRAAHGTAVCGPRLYLFGGVGPEGPLNDLVALDSGLGRWSKIESHCTPSPRLDMAMCSISLPGQPADTSGQAGADTIFIFGGFDTGGNAFDDCYVIVL